MKSIKCFHCFRINGSMKVFCGKTINQIGTIFMKSHLILLKLLQFHEFFFSIIHILSIIKSFLNNSSIGRNSKMQFWNGFKSKPLTPLCHGKSREGKSLQGQIKEIGNLLQTNCNKSIVPRLLAAYKLYLVSKKVKLFWPQNPSEG